MELSWRTGITLPRISDEQGSAIDVVEHRPRRALQLASRPEWGNELPNNEARKTPASRERPTRKQLTRSLVDLSMKSSSKHAASGKFGYAIYHAETRNQWRAWLQRNGQSAPGVWLCSWRSVTGRPRCPYPEVVEEAICFGWIDSTASVLDPERSLQLITPRKPKSSWTRLNRQRFAEMEKAGLMTDGGRRVAEIARANGYWTIYDSVEDLTEPDDLAAALMANAAARAAWRAFPPTARKQMLWWIISAGRPETRQRRIGTLVAKAAVGERAQG